jgi:proteic killer suppression protein
LPAKQRFYPLLRQRDKRAPPPSLGGDLFPGVTLYVIKRSVIRSFRNRATENVFDGRDTPAARRTCPSAVWRSARRKLDQINRVRLLTELAVPPGNRLESLSGDRVGQHSIRINDRFRICFRWEEDGAYEVEITDSH